MTGLTASRYRINSIDILRGIVMVVMALDHVRDFFHRVVVEGSGELATGPTDLATTNPALFFTRFITHFCAPIFVFLAGTSAFLMTFKKSKKELSRFLLTRGVWLVIVEIVIITLGWTFNPLYNFIILQVIWAIGISMIIMGVLVYLPYKILLAVGLLIVFGHNLLDYESISSGLKGGALADLIYFANFSAYSLDAEHFVFIVYSFLPWTGIMIVGYCFGKIFSPHIDPVRRKRILWQSGLGLVILFLLLRVINQYGDPVPWSAQPRGPVFTFLSFININKYPPSLAFISLTIGVGMLMLSWLEPVNNRITGFFRVFGRVPMLYYILHFYVIHGLLVILFYFQGFTSEDIVTDQNPFLFKPPGIGVNLFGVYIVWIIVVLILYPVCKKYDLYKTLNAGKKWWLSYL
jgi:uncharacterized membrane protein